MSGSWINSLVMHQLHADRSTTPQSYTKCNMTQVQDFLQNQMRAPCINNTISNYCNKHKHMIWSCRVEHYLTIQTKAEAISCLEMTSGIGTASLKALLCRICPCSPSTALYKCNVSSWHDLGCAWCRCNSKQQTHHFDAQKIEHSHLSNEAMQPLYMLTQKLITKVHNKCNMQTQILMFCYKCCTVHLAGMQ